MTIDKFEVTQLVSTRQGWRRNALRVGLVVIVLCAFGCEDEVSKRHRKVLTQLAAETDLYPGFRQVGVSDNNKRGIARLFVYYNSSASNDDVKAFYSKSLSANGWTLYHRQDRKGILTRWGDEGLVFRNGDYKIAIEHLGSDPNSMARNYVIAYVWEES